MEDKLDQVDKVDMEEEEEEDDEPLSVRIAPGCALGSTWGGTIDSGGSTTLNSTGISSELTGDQSLSSTMLDGWGIGETSVAQECALRPRTADPRLIEDLRKAIEADTELLPGGSEIRQRTFALRQKTLDLIARDSSLGSWCPPPQAHGIEGYNRHGIGTVPHCARPGILMSQCPTPSYMRTDDAWKEQCRRERKFLPAPPRTAPQDTMETKKAFSPAAPAPHGRRRDTAGSQFGPRPAVRRVGHGPRGGAFPRKHIALLGGVPVTCVDLEG